MRRILVTGGLGYIGSHTVVELIKAGYETIIVDNLSNTTLDVLDQIEEITEIRPLFHAIDVNDKSALEQVFIHDKPDGVIHFAAFKAVGESVEKPLKYYRNNIGGMVSVLEVMKDLGITNIVFSSSCTVYGQPESCPVREDSAVKEATSPYGYTKIVCESILKSLPDLKTVSLRYFNPIGAHESGKIGELPLGVPNNLIPYMTQSASGWRGPLAIHGGDYDTPDGTCIRDYIHVSDLANAHVKALGRIDEMGSAGFEVYNIGTGKGYSVLEVVNTFNEISDDKVQFDMGPRRPGDVEQVWADPAVAEKVLGWRAQYGLKEMLSSAWNWQKNLNVKKMST